MTCQETQNQLPLLVYGDLSAEASQLVKSHLDGCANCQAELTALEHVKQSLAAGPPPEVVVDLAQILNSPAGQLQLPQGRRRLSRWILASAATAALVLLAVAKLEVRAEGQQIVVRWGAPPVVVSPAKSNQISDESVAALEDRVRMLQELTSALASDIEIRDRRRGDDIVRTDTRIENLWRVASQRLLETERDVNALYAAQFRTSEKGANP